MGTSLELDHLRTLVAIAECGGFGKAAAVLHISQPALSQHVRILERSLKRKLFVKDGRGVKFTVAGEEVLAEARQILAAHDQAVSRLVGETEKVVVLGSSEHFAPQVLPEMIRVFHETFPHVTTRFEIGRTTHLIDAVDKGSVDFAFILASRGNESGREIGRLPLKWFAAPDWTPPTDGEPFALVAFDEPCALRERATAALVALGSRVTVAGQSGMLEGVLAGVRAGLGVALLPDVDGAPHGLVARDDLPEVGSAGVNILTRRGLDADIELATVDAGEAFFELRRLQSLDLAG
ncbi:MAG: LysR family transcriptional regulator [Nocardioidaceae bacterium]|nr:LysR family transcriptional regulator [Nocardioidaceae bacterium]